MALRGAGGKLVLRGCNVTDNIGYAGDGGGALLEVGDGGGGGGGAAELEGCLFARNVANGGGGGAAVRGGTAAIRSCRFTGNEATAGAGALIAVLRATVSDSVFEANVARGGGGGGLLYEVCDGGDGDGGAALEVDGGAFIGNLATTF